MGNDNLQGAPKRLRLNCGTDPSCDGELSLPGPIALPIVDPTWFELISRRSASLGEEPNDTSTDDEKNLQVVIQPSTGLAMHEGAGEIWHYTDSAGLIGIIDRNCLWATSMSSLNDSIELAYGLNVLDQLLEEVRDSKNIDPRLKLYFMSLRKLVDATARQRGLFVASASLAENSLAQWRAYGGGQGHAVVLDSSAQLAVVSDVESAVRPDDMRPKWAKVLYNQEAQCDFLAECLGYVATILRCAHLASNECEACRANAVVVAESLAYCKEPSFVEEREVRLVVQSPDDSAIQFRTSRFGITAYLRLTGIAGISGISTKAISKLPIQKVVVGPFDTRHSSAASLPLLLRVSNYGEVPMETSASSLR